LAETGEASVLLLEAGGTDDLPSVSEPNQWHSNLKTERDWGFEASPNPRLNGRRMPLSKGKMLGGGSTINAMGCARGHKNDWDYFAEETGDPSWGYESAASRTGRGLRIRFGAGRAVSSTWSWRAIRIPSPRPCWMPPDPRHSHLR
jgi:choline dehydrogenase-like flavoprotein